MDDRGWTRILADGHDESPCCYLLGFARKDEQASALDVLQTVIKIHKKEGNWKCEEVVEGKEQYEQLAGIEHDHRILDSQSPGNRPPAAVCELDLLDFEACRLQLGPDFFNTVPRARVLFDETLVSRRLGVRTSEVGGCVDEESSPSPQRSVKVSEHGDIIRDMFHHIHGDGKIELIRVLHPRQVFHGESHVLQLGSPEEACAVFHLFHFDVDSIDGGGAKALCAVVRVLAKSGAGIEDADGLVGLAQKGSELALHVPLSQEHQPEQLVEQLAEQDAVADNAADDSFDGIVLQDNEK